MDYLEEFFSNKKPCTNSFFERVKLIRSVARKEIIERLELSSELRIQADELLRKMDVEDEEKFN